MTRSQLEMARERSQSAFYRPVRKPSSVTLQEVVDDVTEELGLKESTQLNRIKEKWLEIAGPQIAANSGPGDLTHQVLVIHVTHPIWMVQLQQFGKHEILRRVRALFPDADIKDLRIRLHHSTD